MDENQLSIENLNKIPLFDDRTDENYLQNYEALEALQTEFYRHIQTWITFAGVGVTAWLAPQVAVPYLVAFGGILLTKEYTVRLARLVDVTRALLAAYGDDGIVVTPRVKTDRATIDILVRMPDRRLFAIAIRGKSGNRVNWREDRQQFFVARPGGKGAKQSWSLMKTMDEIQSIFYLRKIKHPLVGVTSSERSAPIIKTIVLAPGARIAANDDSPLWTEFGEARVLKIQATGVTYLVQFEDLINFLKSTKK